MKTRNTFAVTATAALLFGAGGSLLAQVVPPNPAMPPAGLFRMGQYMMGINGLNAGVVDPSQNSIATLIMRPDVRTELKISSHQREKLDALQTNTNQQMRQKMVDSMQQMRAQFRNNQNNPDAALLTPQERRAQMMEQRQAMMKNMDATMGDLDKQIEAILRPEQMSRLRQLDLQWRGPLAAADPKVAETLQLTPEQRNQATQDLQDYRQAQQSLIRSMFMSGSATRRGMVSGQAGSVPPGPVGAPTPNPNGAADAAPPVFRGPASQQDLQTMQIKMRKESDKARKTAGDKVLAAFTPEQTQQWQVMQGAKFTFRTNF